jgi:hypothetical protein
MNLFDSAVDWLELHTIPCPFHLMTGCDCPGCGMQRSVLSLFRGDIEGSITHHISGIPFVLFLFVFLFHLKLQNRYTKTTMNVLIIAVVVLAMLQYLWKWYSGRLCF